MSGDELVALLHHLLDACSSCRRLAERQSDARPAPLSVGHGANVCPEDQDVLAFLAILCVPMGLEVLGHDVQEADLRRLVMRDLGLSSICDEQRRAPQTHAWPTGK